MPVCTRCLSYPLCTCMSLAGDHCGECGDDPCSCIVQDEPHAEKSPLSLKRSNAFIATSPVSDDNIIEEVEDSGDEEILMTHKKYQKHFKEALHCDESYSPEPDLDAYFDDYRLSAQQRIAMCRTYANYLTQKLRASGKLGQPRPKKK